MERNVGQLCLFVWMRGLQAIELCWTCLQALAATVYCFIRLFEALGCHSNTRSADVCVCACVCNGGVKSDGERNRPQFPPVPVLGKWVKGKTKVHLFHFPHTHKPTVFWTTSIKSSFSFGGRLADMCFDFVGFRWRIVGLVCIKPVNVYEISFLVVRWAAAQL